ncbi:MAG: hypothetical protein WBE92_06795 [Steroidobacteraceae bacterium]
MSLPDTRRRMHGAALGGAAAVALLWAACPGVASPQAATAPGAAEPVPRLADGHPDLNGTWDNGAGIDFLHPEKLSGGSVCVAGCDPPPAAPPPATRPRARRSPPHADFPQYKTQYQATVKRLNDDQLQMDGVLHCRSPGLPRIGPPDKIVQTPGQVVFLYDDVSGAFWRIIPTDGRPHRSDVENSTLGDAVGHWEGDTLVVDSGKFTDDTWLTDNGAFHSSSMHVIERLRRVGDILEWRVTVEDPAVLVEPWKIYRTAKLTHVELVEPTPCVDHDISHAVDTTHHPNPR